MEYNEEQKNRSIKDTLLQKIRVNELTMHPKSYFVLKAVLIIFVALAILIVSILILNFISFTIRINGEDSLLKFGEPGFLVFLQLFPWALLIIDTILIVFLEWLLRQFRFATKIPVLYLLIVILIVTVSVGLFIDRGTRLNDDFLSRADQHHLSAPFSNYFEGARQVPSSNSAICKCLITAIHGDTLIVQDVYTGTTTHLTIILPPNNSTATPTFNVGDTIFVAGERHDDTINAFGISQFPSQLF